MHDFRSLLIILVKRHLRRDEEVISGQSQPLPHNEKRRETTNEKRRDTNKASNASPSELERSFLDLNVPSKTLS